MRCAFADELEELFSKLIVGGERGESIFAAVQWLGLPELEIFIDEDEPRHVRSLLKHTQSTTFTHKTYNITYIIRKNCVYLLVCRICVFTSYCTYGDTRERECVCVCVCECKKSYITNARREAREVVVRMLGELHQRGWRSVEPRVVRWRVRVRVEHHVFSHTHPQRAHTAHRSGHNERLVLRVQVVCQRQQTSTCTSTLRQTISHNVLRPHCMRNAAANFLSNTIRVSSLCVVLGYSIVKLRVQHVVVVLSSAF